MLGDIVYLFLFLLGAFVLLEKLNNKMNSHAEKEIKKKMDEKSAAIAAGMFPMVVHHVSTNMGNPVGPQHHLTPPQEGHIRHEQ